VKLKSYKGRRSRKARHKKLT